MRRIVRLTERDLSRIVNRVINEAGEVQMIDTQLMSKFANLSQVFSSELGQDIDIDTIKDTTSCTMEDFQPPAGTDPEGLNVFQQLKQKVMELVKSKSIEPLKEAFNALRNVLKNAKSDKNNKSLQEQVAALAAPFTLLGISAPIGVWIIIGVIALALLIAGMVWIISWIPKSSGSGCSRKVTKRVRAR